MTEQDSLLLMAQEAADRAQLSLVDNDSAVITPDGKRIAISDLRYNSALSFFSRKTHPNARCEVYGKK